MSSVAGLRVVLLCLLLCLVSVSAFGGTVDIYSNLLNESNNQTGTDVVIPVSPAWQVHGPGYEWVSYAQTGCNSYNSMTGICTPGPANPPGVVGVITGPDAVTPTAVFYKTFTITDPSDSGTLDVWADDTASVWLYDGTYTGTDPGNLIPGATMLIDANPVAGPNCADGPVSCVPGLDAAIPLTLSTGTYTLIIDAYQFVGGTPFGVMYAGVLSSTPSVPEPATYMLLGLGLTGLGVLARRKKA